MNLNVLIAQFKSFESTFSQNEKHADFYIHNVCFYEDQTKKQLSHGLLVIHVITDFIFMLYAQLLPGDFHITETSLYKSDPRFPPNI